MTQRNDSYTKNALNILKATAATISVGALASCQFPDPVAPGAKISTTIPDPYPYKIVRERSPDLLSFNELAEIAEDPDSSGRAQNKAEQLFSSPFLDNTTYFTEGIPEPSVHPQIGPSIRVSSWNIEKSLRIKDVTAILESESEFRNRLMPEMMEDKELRNEAVRQRADLAASDILILQEMDIGHYRSGYVFAAQHLARKLGMNFIYAPQQLELEPFQADGSAPVLRSNYKGVFGAAILSRYPIKRVKVFPLNEQPYDWYFDELKSADFVESGRRFGAKTLFNVETKRELKVGGRGFTRVDLHVPNVPHETITVINVHLEIKTTPIQRKRQLEEILENIRDIENPVILAGDFNSSSQDVSATSFVRMSTRTTANPSNLLSAGLFLANITGVTQVRRIINSLKNFRDPLAVDIPAILPNKKKSLFGRLENFRFNDGGAFDFRGDKERSMNGIKGKLSNSNQRHFDKGFTFTFSVPRPIGPIGQDRLDWIFVKSFLTDPTDKDGSYKLAPHFGETLNLINLSVKERFSDHHPITTVIPLEEPPR